MKKLIYTLMISGLFTFGTGVANQVMAQDDSVVDTLSIDDGGIVSLPEENTEENNNTGMLVAVVAVALVAGVVIFRFVGKKKK